MNEKTCIKIQKSDSLAIVTIPSGGNNVRLQEYLMKNCTYSTTDLIVDVFFFFIQCKYTRGFVDGYTESEWVKIYLDLLEMAQVEVSVI